MDSDKPQVLVVDDNERNRNIILKILGKEYDVVLTESGEDALSKLKEIEPAVILLDVMMPGLNGYEVCKIIRTDEALKNIKILMVSGRSMLKERLKGYDAGADDYMIKPFDSHELKAKVSVYCKLHLVTKELVKRKEQEAVHALIATCCHEINNPLAIAASSLELAKKDGFSTKYIQDIESAHERIVKILIQLDKITKTQNLVYERYIGETQMLKIR